MPPGAPARYQLRSAPQVALARPPPRCGRTQTAEHIAVEFWVGVLPPKPVLLQQPLGGEVAARSIMRVERVHRHTLEMRAHRLRERVAERVVTLVADPDPIEDHHHDWCPGAKQYDPASGERCIDASYWAHAAVAERAANRWSHVYLKTRRTQHSCPRRCSFHFLLLGWLSCSNADSSSADIARVCCHHTANMLQHTLLPLRHHSFA
jgi:hypothetical protein